MKSSKAKNASRLVHFTDARSPHEIRRVLEDNHSMCFNAQVKDGLLEFNAAGKHYHFPLRFRLAFLAAHPQANAYSLFIEATWEESLLDHNQFLKSTQSWFDFWFQDFKPQPEIEHLSINERYQELVAETMEVEAQLSNIPYLQQQILTALRNGSRFFTSNKEGGTHIGFQKGQFFRQNYGEFEDGEIFTDEAAFLAYLRGFYEWEVSRPFYPEKAPEEMVWRLINFKHRPYRTRSDPDD